MNTLLASERPNAFERINKTIEDIFRPGHEFWIPVVDVKETPKEFVFIAELPGVVEKNVDVELSGDVLTIRGFREFCEEDNRDDYVRIERGYGRFQRSFTLGTPVKAERVQATFKGGLLQVTVPKSESKQAVKVPIKAG